MTARTCDSASSRSIQCNAGNPVLQVLVLATGAAGKAQVQDFTAGAVFPVLIASYESIRLVADQLAGYCDLLICDEGHRCAQTQPEASHTLSLTKHRLPHPRPKR